MIASSPAVRQPQAALYGAGAPRYVLFAGLSPEPDSRAVYDDFAPSFEKRNGAGSVGRPRPVTGGLTCATLTAQGVDGAVCMWAGDRSNGFLVDYTSADVATLGALTRAVRGQVNGA